MREDGASVLVIDDDADILDLVEMLLTDAGYRVSALRDMAPDAIRAAVNRVEPDCILLDGEGSDGFGSSWEDAAWAAGRSRPVPVIMFTVDVEDMREAEAGTSVRSRVAGFAALIRKPFDVDALLAAVAEATRRGTPYDASPMAERMRTDSLVEMLVMGGARDIVTGSTRESIAFIGPRGGVVHLFWSQSSGAYVVARRAPEGTGSVVVGRFFDMWIAVGVALALRPPDAPASP